MYIPGIIFERKIFHTSPWNKRIRETRRHIHLRIHTHTHTHTHTHRQTHTCIDAFEYLPEPNLRMLNKVFIGTKDRSEV